MEGCPWIWSSNKSTRALPLKALLCTHFSSGTAKSRVMAWGTFQWKVITASWLGPTRLLWQGQCITPYPSRCGHQFPLKVGVALKSRFAIWFLNPLCLPLCSPLSHLLARCEGPGPSGGPGGGRDTGEEKPGPWNDCVEWTPSFPPALEWWEKNQFLSR